MKLIKDLGMKFPTETSKKKKRYGLYECERCKEHIEVVTADVVRRDQKRCKPCSRFKHEDEAAALEAKREAVRNYKKTPKGLISNIYKQQRKSSRERKMNLPIYSNEELQNWCLTQTLFTTLYDNWVASNYEKNLVPSVDRKDDKVPYTMENIQLMTWLENKTKNEQQIKRGEKPRLVKAVCQYTKADEFIEEFFSLSEAERSTGINVSNISNVCNGRYGFKTAGGFIWKWKEKN